MRIIISALIWFGLFIGCKSQEEQQSTIPHKVLNHEIRLFFGVNNNYPRPDSMVILITDPENKIVLENRGYNPVWGLLDKGRLSLSGRYNYLVKFYSDSNTVSQFSNYFDINGDEEGIDFSVNVSPYLPRGAEAYVSKYYGNRHQVDFIRKWEPQKEYQEGDSMAPLYAIKNNADSVIYGIYRVRSSMFATSWARLHYAAYTQIERWEKDHWVPLPINTCVIEAKIEKGQTHNAYPNLVYKTARKDLNGPGKFRIELEYGINDIVTRMSDSLSKTYPNLYYEVHICRCFDEFELK